jgi:cystathionine gamma-synthase
MPCAGAIRVRSVSTPLDRSTAHEYRNGEPGPYSYARASSPTVAEAERRLGELDGGHALLFASGSAACTAILLGLLEPGATVALAEGSYYGTGVLLDELRRWGLRKVEFDQTGAPPEGADLVWLEAPSNPFLTMPDFDSAAAHAARVVCDATAATPVHVRPLELGCDIVVHSATKYLGGHDDVLLGVVACRREEDHRRLSELRYRTGANAGADAAWLLLRSLETLDLRVERQTASARMLAERLRGHPAVQVVRYPGFGGLLSFDVADAESARRTETATRLVVNGTSLGGATSRIEARARWEGERVPPGLLRLAVGLEDADAIWADLEQALGHASPEKAEGVAGESGSPARSADAAETRHVR